MNNKMKLKEKLAYGLINLGDIPITLLVSSYLLIFYTNIVGLDPAACATLFLIARILDAVNDPIVGFVVDHIPGGKFGHFRKTLLIGSILCSLNFLLLWFGPYMIPAGKLVIAYVSYILLGFIFPVMDISINSLLSVMTEDMEDRNSLSTFKGLFLMLGGLGIGILAPLLIQDQNNAAGYVRMIIVFTIVILGFSVIGTLGVHERITAKPEQKYRISDLPKILAQKPVYSFFIVNLIYGIGTYICTTANTYFYAYVLGNLALASVASLLSMVGMIPGVAVSGILAKKFGKKNTYIIGLILFGVVPLIRLLDVSSVPLTFIGTIILNFGTGILTPHMYGMLADNTDYVELKTGFRAEAAVASLSSFTAKVSMGIGGAIPGYILATMGFAKDSAVQSSQVNNGIVLCVVILPAVISVVAALIMKFMYPIGKAELEAQTATLKGVSR